MELAEAESEAFMLVDKARKMPEQSWESVYIVSVVLANFINLSQCCRWNQPQRGTGF